MNALNQKSITFLNRNQLNQITLLKMRCSHINYYVWPFFFYYSFS